MKIFKQYLLGRRFRVRTDHAALSWLRHTPDPIGQQARWLERMEEFDFVIEHRAGKSHGNADALSRIICPKRDCACREGGYRLVEETMESHTDRLFDLRGQQDDAIPDGEAVVPKVRLNDETKDGTANSVGPADRACSHVMTVRADVHRDPDEVPVDSSSNQKCQCELTSFHVREVTRNASVSLKLPSLKAVTCILVISNQTYHLRT